MKVLLSIKPEFVEKILTGEKKFEFRKNRFRKENITSVVIYSTMPVGMVVGEFEVITILQDTPELLWKKTNSHAGIDKSFFDEYYEEKILAYAIKIGKVKEYKRPLSLSELGENITAPQSYRYL